MWIRFELIFILNKILLILIVGFMQSYIYSNLKRHYQKKFFCIKNWSKSIKTLTVLIKYEHFIQLSKIKTLTDLKMYEQFIQLENW